MNNVDITKPQKITRKEAEQIVRQVLRGKLGEVPFEKDLFKNSVEELLLEVNGPEDKDHV
jgi:hypothetical protein